VTGLGQLAMCEFDHTAANRRPRRTSGSMHRADSTTAPRLRLGRHGSTTITFIQLGQQCPQSRPHRQENLIIFGSHDARPFSESTKLAGTTRSRSEFSRPPLG